MKPPIQYFGSKIKLAPKIVDLLPAHQGYVEPFAGSLAVLLAKPKSRLEVVNDLNMQLVTFWRMLREHPQELAEMCELTPHSRVELEHAQQLDGANDLEVARQVWVLLTQGRGRAMRHSGWRSYVSPQSSFVSYMTAYRRRLLPAAERIVDVQIECRDALDVIRDYGQHADTVLYVDPPYLNSTRGRDARYIHEMADAAAHEKLAEALKPCPAKVVLSGYPSPLYDRLYAEWNRTDFVVDAGNSLVRHRTECVWLNYEPPEVENVLDCFQNQPMSAAKSTIRG